MRGSTKGLTLRKGIIEKKLGAGWYLVKDALNGNEIRMGMSGGLRMQNIELEIGALVYLVVSIHDLSKGRLAREGHRGGLEEFSRQKALLDKNIDPMKDCF